MGVEVQLCFDLFEKLNDLLVSRRQEFLWVVLAPRVELYVIIQHHELRPKLLLVVVLNNPIPSGANGADVKGKGKDLDYVVAEDGRANATENAVAPGAGEATKQEQEAPTHTHVKESKPAAKAEITVAADKSKEEVNEESKDDSTNAKPDIKVAKDEAEAAIAEVIF